MTERPPSDEQSSEGHEADQGGALGAVVLHHTVTALMLVLILALSVWAYLTFRQASFFHAPDDRADSRVETYVLESQLQRVEFALAVYFRLEARYPSNLDQLVSRGLLLESDLFYPSGPDRLAYERTADGYSLELAAP